MRNARIPKIQSNVNRQNFSGGRLPSFSGQFDSNWQNALNGQSFGALTPQTPPRSQYMTGQPMTQGRTNPNWGQMSEINNLMSIYKPAEVSGGLSNIVNALQGAYLAYQNKYRR